ncbi:MAG: PQQ-dependent sugar dehydrogenase [Verrucomicrobia bacterium]|nr:PQQ-dependent sugar dehydrogenase [Verrucomicrobiota bacterium]
MNPVIRLTCIGMLSLGCAGIVSVNAQNTQKPAEKPKPSGPTPSGPQTDGAFRKVILDGDRETDGEWRDTVIDPMEMAVAPDGRVLWAERAGVVKMWKPETKSTVVIGKVKVFDGLEDGLLGITIDPNFAKNGWVYLNHSTPETTKDEKGHKTGDHPCFALHVEGRAARHGFRKEDSRYPDAARRVLSRRRFAGLRRGR